MRKWSVSGLSLIGALAVTLVTVNAPQQAHAATTYGAVDIVAAANGGRVVAASSELRDRRGGVEPRWRKENLIDGKRVEGDLIPADSYGWATDGAPGPRDPAWVVFAFAGDKLRNIGAVRLDPRTEDPQAIGRWVRGFAIEVSVTTPEGPWQRVDSFELINLARPQEFAFSSPVPAKYVRLLVTTNQGSNSSVSLGEFEVLEALTGDDEVTEVISGMEAQLSKLRHYASVHGTGTTVPLTDGLPPYKVSLIAAANGGHVLRESSEASDEKNQPLPQWRATNLIDARVAKPDEAPGDGSFGWSSNNAPSETKPEWVIFEIPVDPGALIDTALVDPTARDPWSIGRGAKDIEIAVATGGPDGPWMLVGRWQLPREPKPQLLHFAPTEAKYVRLSVLSNFGSNRYTELGEFGVYRLYPDQNVLDGICSRIENALTELKKYREGALEQPRR